MQASAGLEWQLWGMAAAGETDARGAPKPLASIGRAHGYRAIDPRYLELARRRPGG